MVTEYFEIIKKDVTSRDIMVYADDIKYNGKPGGFKVLPRILDNGKTMSKYKDIMKFSKADGCRYFYASSDRIGEEIGDNAAINPGENGLKIEVRVRVAGRPRGAYTGEAELSGYYWVYTTGKNIKKARVVAQPVDYNEGNEIIPINKSDFSLIMPGESEPLDSKCFEIISKKQNRFIGMATIVISGRNGYEGTKNFRIKIRKRSLGG